MTVSELIADLKAFKAQHGDGECIVFSYRANDWLGVTSISHVEGPLGECLLAINDD